MKVEGGRFYRVDPLADHPNNISFTPYHYVANNPIMNVDPDGRNWYENEETGDVHWQKGEADIAGFKNLGANYASQGKKGITLFEQQYKVGFISNEELQNSEELPEFGLGDFIIGSLKAGLGIDPNTGDEQRDRNIEKFMMLTPTLGGISSKAKYTTTGLRLAKSDKAFILSFTESAMLHSAGRVMARGKKNNDLPRLMSQYGGNADDWAKMTSSAYANNKGFTLEVHWYQNLSTGAKYEFKTKVAKGWWSK